MSTSKTLIMRLPVLLLVFAVLYAACSKNNNDGVSQFYGTWVKGNQAGDTIWFMRKNGKDIMRTNQSFNPQLPVYTEDEYRFVDGKLRRVLPIYASSLGTIESFAWTQQGEQFELLGFQLYHFMSSMNTKFTFTKIR